MSFRSLLLRRSARLVFSVASLLFLVTHSARAADVAWQRNVTEGVRTAARQNRPLFVMMKAGWCGACHRMLRESLADPQVARRLNEDFVPILVDADQNADLVRKLKVDSLPTVLLIGTDPKSVRRVTGYQTAEQIDALLRATQKSVPPRGTGLGIGTRPAIAPESLADNPYRAAGS